GVPLQLSAAVYGATPIDLRWRLNGAELVEGMNFSGTTTDVLNIASTTYADMGDYTLVASNAFGMVTTLVAQVQVTPIVAWGDNTFRQLEVPLAASNVIAASAGGQHSLALRS